MTDILLNELVIAICVCTVEFSIAHAILTSFRVCQILFQFVLIMMQLNVEYPCDNYKGDSSPILRSQTHYATSSAYELRARRNA